MSKEKNKISDSKEQITCPVCGETFVEYKSRERTYCSQDCQHASLEGDFAGDQFDTPTGKDHPRYVERDTKTCGVCGDDFQVRSTSEQEYCSYECGQKSRRNEILKKSCPTCGDSFETPADTRENKYCSYDCAMDDQRGKSDESVHTKSTCKVCGDTFAHYENRDRVYCSEDCHTEMKKGETSPNWKGGWQNYYGSTWTTDLKDKVRDRDDRECQVCGKPESENRRALEVHHITPFAEFGVENHEEANRMKNLVSLCGDCHMKVEYDKIEVTDSD